MEMVTTLKELLHLHPLYNEQLKSFANFGGDFHDASRLSDMGASLTSASEDLLQAVLEQLSVPERWSLHPITAISCRISWQPMAGWFQEISYRAVWIIMSLHHNSGARASLREPATHRLLGQSRHDVGLHVCPCQWQADGSELTRRVS